MKISLNTIRGLNKRFGCTGDIAPNGIADLTQKVGAQLAAVEKVEDYGKKYSDVVIAKVISCDPHPNADKLKVCTIDDGDITPNVNRSDNNLIQVVCGAPNARAGLTVAWLPPGSTVPESYNKEPFVLEAREIRGVVSNGMLASPKELGIGDNHDGILEIDGDMQPGTLFADKYELRGDSIIELENKMFTHRPDCFGFLGISRELAGIQSMPFKSPSWYVLNPEFPTLETDELPLQVINEIPDLTPRFTAITMANVVVQPSPVWLQIELAKVGLRPINNIVDYTNFFMLETGQPLHAYDYDKVAALNNNQPKLIVRKPKTGEKLKLLNGKEIAPHADAILIATDKQAIGLGGVMGGSETEVDEQSKNIILECANFDMYNIRRTAMTHGIFTDAVTRFNKGQSPLQNLAVLAKIVDEIRKFADGNVASNVIDDNHLPEDVLERGAVTPLIIITTEFINARLGVALSTDEISQLLVNVEFKVTSMGNELSILAPFWRTDIEIPEDVVEEVGRLYGYDHLPLELPKRDLTPAPINELIQFKSQVRSLLAKAGANELLTYSFVHGNLLDRVGQDRDVAFKLTNAISPELQYYRVSLMPSLLDKVHANIKAGFDEFAIFEIGKTHDKSNVDKEGLPIEEERLSLVFAAEDKAAKRNYAGSPYYQGKRYIEILFSEFGVETVFESAASHEPKEITGQQCLAPFERSRSGYVKTQDGVLLGFIGEIKSEVRRALKLPDFTVGFEIDLKRLLACVDKNSTYTALSRFPSVTQDISLKVPNDLKFAELYNFIRQNIDLPESAKFSLLPVDIYQRDQEKAYKQITLRFIVASYIKTLIDEEVNKLLDDVAAKAHAQFGAERL